MTFPQAKLFDTCVEVYTQYRPKYPEAAIAALLAGLKVGANGLICDLGAGPGTLSFLLAERGIRLLAVEPLARMRTRGASLARERGLPVHFVAGRAEAIPLGDQSVAAVVCGQAFHWFESSRAMGEIHRLLKPGGGLALLWNNRDWHHIGWLADVERLLMRYNPQYDPDYRSRDWAQVLKAGQLFSSVKRFEFLFDQEMGIEEVSGLVESFSYVRILPVAARQALQHAVRARLERVRPPQDGKLRMRYRTELYLACRA